MTYKVRYLFLLLFLITCIPSAFAQQRLKFRVVDFSYDAFDQTARNERFKKIDGSGFLYAIVKVTGDSPTDKLGEYRFNFGNMNHIVEDHDGELWLYVQKNAKTVTISRSGYATLHHYDLNTTIESGKTYRLKLSVQLNLPTPITGTLSLNSRPLGANIQIDGKDYGITPCNVKGLLIGHHSVVVSKDGYATKKEECNIRENETLSLELTLEKPDEADAPQLRPSDDDKTFTVKGITFTMKLVVGGTFTMGASEQDDDAQNDEKPAHQVTLSDYYIGETEVTQELWQAVMGTSITQKRDKTNTLRSLAGVGNNLPMHYIDWNECQEFVKKLNLKTGQKFRLPTEAEWEYAARGGAKSRGYKYSGSNNLNDVAWYIDNSDINTNSVKTKAPNELGIYDMSGNVWEWCNDWYRSYNNNAQTNPIGPLSGSCRVCRGGSLCLYAQACRVSARSFETPVFGSQYIGLRLAMDIKK